MIVLLVAVLECTSTTRRPSPLRTSGAGDPFVIRSLVTAALEADAQGRGGDSLYSSDATVLANGRPRINPPKFAGVGPVGGRVIITSFQSQGTAALAWAQVDYRWVYSETNATEAGTATIIIQRRPQGWRIVHAHSSQLLPWDRPPPRPRN